MTKHKTIFYILAIFLTLSCQNLQGQNCDLTSFNELYSKTKIIEYQHIKIFDNKFNSTITYDTFNVTIFKLGNEKVGFQILSKEHEWFYDSNELIELNHINKTKSIETINDLVGFPHWDKNLLSMLDTLSKKKCELKSIDNVLYQYYSSRLVSRSSVDSNKLLINHLEYTFTKLDFGNFLHKETIIRDNDTLQIQNHFFKNISFQSKKSFKSIEKRIKNTSYQLLEDDEALPFGKEAIQEGDEISRKEFNDIENNSIQIISNEKKYSLIIFSFIGCSPCEMALNQLKEDKLGLKNKVDLYYSSFQNENNAVRKYLENKEIFQHAFAKESNMINEFRLPVSPTFVLIDSNGKIRKIIEGFDNSVLTTLNEIINTP